jgi:hypothetical protein
MQYKCTIGDVAVQQYAVVRCDIDRYGGSLMVPSYKIIQFYLDTKVTREQQGFAFHK